MKKTLLLILLSSFIASVLAQEPKQGPNIKEMVGGKDYEIVKIGDTVWRFEKEGQIQGYGTPVDETLLLAKLNNRTRTAGTCFVLSRLLTIGGTALEIYNLNKKGGPSSALHIISGVMGGVAVISDFAACVMLINNKVYLTPDGVIVKLNQPENKRKKE